MRKNDIIATLALKQVKGVGAVAIKSLWQKGLFQNENYYKTLENCLTILNKEVPDREIEVLTNHAQEIIFSSSNCDVKILHIADEYYPHQLAELKDPPSVLFYKGNLPKTKNVLGIIGTRDPDVTALEISKRIASYFHEKGYFISNGLALGIDEGCIKQGNGILQNVIGVVAGGLNYNENKTLLKTTALLAEQVLEAGGLLVSEFENNVKEDTFKVIKSCRLQAGLANGLILVQSKLDGGSKYTLEAFCSLNRALGIVSVPNKHDSPLYEANNVIIRHHREGLSKMTGLKPNKIITNKICAISSKSDYLVFENDISTLLKLQSQNKALFD